MKAIYQQNPIIPKIFLGINLFFLLIWGYAKSFDVYKFILTGAFYELAWLPTLFAFFCGLLGFVIFLDKRRFAFKFSIFLFVRIFGSFIDTSFRV